MHAILLFALGILIDWLWALSALAINEKRATSAGALMALFTMTVTASTWWIVEDRSVLGLLAYAAGGGVGTWFAVRRSGR